MNHSINITHDGTLILRVPRGYKINRVKVEEIGSDKEQYFDDVTNEDRWIPCSERMPVEEGYYLVWIDAGFCERVHYYNGFWNAFSHCTKNAIKGVVAWRPDPAPYEEEKNGRV